MNHKFQSINRDTNELHDLVDDLYEALADGQDSEAVNTLDNIIEKSKTLQILLKKNL